MVSLATIWHWTVVVSELITLICRSLNTIGTKRPRPDSITVFLDCGKEDLIERFIHVKEWIALDDKTLAQLCWSFF